MGASRTLLRKLDIDLINRIEASGRPEKPKKSERKKKPRPFESYRQNGRRPKAPVMDGSYRGPIFLNRSQNWLRAKTYARAREISPSAEPVR